ncbi:murein L,D-transpeptidase catalytic domain family protein [Hymenobacter sp. BT683]|uniref:Murein L,D-transpeptidase catalytic domain family protein n=1 Tax=Hymenobacter jeongseonensis TaxID=2791027 RepID=A0ABS0IK20_9BACT|nr:murein L,D-transpeptidase catalytic domain family protein [Hymenobacter jeongseonensis]MBF9238727.1 murein L,D-transpeptidase catalytic domain family protein [Hymenobacter jeongseonensis]
MRNSTAAKVWGRRGLLIALAAFAAGCQLRADELGGVSTKLPVTTHRAALASPPAPATIPDSLALTPIPLLAEVPDTLRQAIQQLHAALGPEAADLRPEVLEQACVGYLTLHPTGRIERAGLLAVADMDLPNTTPRLWVLDLRNGRVLHHSLVAHGEGSGKLRATRFSNLEKSACTSLGFYRTAGTYEGIHGYSRRIEGLDKGQNANAFDRYVVLHAADYASPKYIQQHGRLGYSRGCPALPPEQFKEIIASVRVGSMLLISGPGLASRWLDGRAAGKRFLARGWE